MQKALTILRKSILPAELFTIQLESDIGSLVGELGEAINSPEDKMHREHAYKDIADIKALLIKDKPYVNEKESLVRLDIEKQVAIIINQTEQILKYLEEKTPKD